ncbi:S9 family peptidase [Sediminibacterium roseum]|uniref:S9 family peptidase n=1 Tax=Sediminibacterium roseum TaxID=1978412 RepID=A0ABW9ZW36_9BACT|nr:S9 family peptidase [Sediminibacterium roseum]NCI49265.1 S9 family peptidase [Sediminibacterium roseum]
MKKNICLILGCLILFSFHTNAQGIKWTRDGNGFFTIEGGEIFKTELPALTKTTVLAKALLKPKDSANPLPVRDFIFSADDKKVLIYTNTKRVWRADTRGDYWLLDLTTNNLRKLGRTRPSSSLMFAKFSPDGTKVAYVSEFNIYVEDAASGKITPLTTGGTRKIINGTFDWVYEEEFNCRDGFRWSPDSKKIAYWQIDATNTKNYLMLNTTDSIYPFAVPVEYPSAGEPPSPYKIGVVDVATVKTKWMSLPTDPVLQSYVPRMEWAGNSSQLILQHLDRKQQESNIMICDVASGASHSIHKEVEKAWIDAASSLSDKFWLNGGKEFLWSSEKDGWDHLYRISRDGKTETLITRGNYDVISVNAVDDAGGYVYFYASPDNATQRYLYRTKLDGSAAPERLSPANQQGTHSYTVSPTGKFAQHSFSNYYTPSSREWVTLPDHKAFNGDNVNTAVAKADKSKSNIEFFKVKTEDGVEMDGWMVKPTNFDRSKKYPVVFFVYTEPAGANAKDQYGAGFNNMYKGNMANDGYIYITIDNRGTPVPKGREWRKSIYRQIGRLNIRDQAMGAKEISKWPFVDTSRIAVWGWSGGGSATLDLLFQYPEIYKTGISIAAVGNQLTYDNIYQERYMGLPQENMEDFVKGSPITYAKNLRGHLLYVHGTGDDNVHYNNAEKLINELVANGKQFQLMSYPNRTHGISEGKGTTAHLQQLYTDFLRMYCPPGGR